MADGRKIVVVSKVRYRMGDTGAILSDEQVKTAVFDDTVTLGEAVDWAIPDSSAVVDISVFEDENTKPVRPDPHERFLERVTSKMKAGRSQE